MMNKLVLLLLGSFSIFLLDSCKKKEDPGPSTSNVATNMTPTGAMKGSPNTFSVQDTTLSLTVTETGIYDTDYKMTGTSSDGTYIVSLAFFNGRPAHSTTNIVDKIGVTFEVEDTRTGIIYYALASDTLKIKLDNTGIPTISFPNDTFYTNLGNGKRFAASGVMVGK